MPNKTDSEQNQNEIDPQDLVSLMQSINRDVDAQKALFEQNHSASACAAELLILLQEARRKLEIITKV